MAKIGEVNLDADTASLEAGISSGRKSLSGFQTYADSLKDVELSADSKGVTSGTGAGRRVLSGYKTFADQIRETNLEADAKGVQSGTGAGLRYLKGYQGFAERIRQTNLSADPKGVSSGTSSARRLLSGYKTYSDGVKETQLSADSKGVSSGVSGARRLLSGFKTYADSVKQVIFTGDTSQLVRSVGYARTQLGSLEGSMSSVGLVGTGLTGVLGVAGVAGGMGLVSSAAVGFNNKLQQSRIAFDTMLGSAKAGKQMIADLANFAKATPFEFSGLVESTQKLLAFGFEGKEIIPVMRDIGNTSAALGGGTEGVDRITYALGQMKAATVAQLGELNQLTEMGVPAYQILADVTGKSAKEAKDLASAGKVSADEFIKGFREFSQKNYGGMMAEQAKTAGGAWSTLRDNLEQGTAKAFRPAFNALTGLVNVLAKMAGSKPAQQFISSFSQGLKGAVKSVTGFVQQVQQVISPSGPLGAAGTGGGLASFVGGMINTLRSALPQVKSLIGQAFTGIVNIAKQLWPQIQPIITNIVMGFKAMIPILRPLGAFLGGVLKGAFMAILPILKLVSQGFRLFGQLVGWIGQKLQPFTPLIHKIGVVVGFVLGTLLPGAVGKAIQAFGGIVRVIPILGRFAGPVIGGVGKAVSLMAKVAGAGFKLVARLIGGLVKLAIPAFTKLGSTIASRWNLIRTVTSKVWGWVGSFLKSAWSKLTSLIGGSVKKIGSNISMGWNKIRSLTSTVFNAVRNFLSGVWNKVASTIGGRVKTIMNNVSSGWNKVKSVTSTVYNAVRNFLSTAWTKIVDGIKSKVNSAWQTIQSGWNKVKSTTSTVYNAIRNFIGSTWDKIWDKTKSVVTTLVDGVKKAWNALKSAAGPIWKGIASAMTNAMEAARDTLKGIWNGILDAIAKILDAVQLKDWASKVRSAKWGSSGGGGGGTSAREAQSANSAGGIGRARGGVTLRNGRMLDQFATGGFRQDRFASGGMAGPRQPRMHLWGEGSYDEAFVTTDPRYRKQNLGYLSTIASRLGQIMIPKSQRSGGSQTHARMRERAAARTSGVAAYATGGLSDSDISAMKKRGEQAIGHPYGHGVAAGPGSYSCSGLWNWIVTGSHANEGGTEAYFPGKPGWKKGGGEVEIAVTMSGGGGPDDSHMWGDVAGTAFESIVSKGVYHGTKAGSIPSWMGGHGPIKIWHIGDAGAAMQGGGGAGGGSIPNPLQALFERMWSSLVEPKQKMIQNKLGSGFVLKQAAGTLVSDGIDALHDWIDEKIPDTIGGGGGGDAGVGSDALGGSRAKNRKLGEQMFHDSNLGGSWSSLDKLWMRESGWDRFADNPTSTAYGIPQNLHPETYPPGGNKGEGSKAGPQISWGLNYIKGRYGTTDKAWQHSQSTGWYRGGGIVPGRKGLHYPIWASGGEMVLGQDIASSILRSVRGGGGPRPHRTVEKTGTNDGLANVYTLRLMREIRDELRDLAPKIVDSMDHKIRHSEVTHRELRQAEKVNTRRLSAQGPRHERGR